MTGGLRTGDSKKFESIRINLRDLAWSQVFPRDPGFWQPWIPGTRPGTTPGIPSKKKSNDVGTLAKPNPGLLEMKYTPIHTSGNGYLRTGFLILTVNMVNPRN